MRCHAIGFVLAISSGFPFCACSTGPTTTTTGSGGAGGWDCHDVLLFGDPCDACLADKCCADLSACGGSSNCIYCTTMDEEAATCSKEPQRSFATAIHECGWNQCREECAIYGRSLGPDPNDPINKFCSTVGSVFCDALFTCCTAQNVLDGFGGTLEGCKATMTGPNCLREVNLDDSYIRQDIPYGMYYGLRRRMKDGQTILDQAQLDACVAGLTPMAAGGAACVAAVPHFFIVECLTAFKGQLALGDACSWYPHVLPGLTNAFIPCKEGRCEEGKCIPLRKTGDTCDRPQPIDSPGACDYLHGDACYVDIGINLWACGPRKEIGDACDSLDGYPECKSGHCDANQTCAPATSISACSAWY